MPYQSGAARRTPLARDVVAYLLLTIEQVESAKVRHLLGFENDEAVAEARTRISVCISTDPDFDRFVAGLISKLSGH